MHKELAISAWVALVERPCGVALEVLQAVFQPMEMLQERRRQRVQKRAAGLVVLIKSCLEKEGVDKETLRQRIILYVIKHDGERLFEEIPSDLWNSLELHIQSPNAAP